MKNPVDVLKEFKETDALLKEKLDVLYRAKIIDYDHVDTYYNELIVTIFKNHATSYMDMIIADRVAEDCVLNDSEMNIAKDVVLKSATLSVLGHSLSDISEKLEVDIDEIRYACDILSIKPNEIGGEIDAVVCREEEASPVN
jgi:hypothetical protein